MGRNMPKPDNRKDNVDRLQENVANTIENIEASHESLEFANETEQQQIKEKNKRREQSIEGMRQEIKDEAKNQ
ncbi:small acid-soluble spore protein Tlp [Halobacillus rhizosphaerae]|uniref:small acid-soluble spore protein Tlp n=1 Tax=Halobacillus rhizosphaerae TaxID=3064889 RepID=UPI00398A6CFC